ncbi:C45 family autoproteolytic acyltransferase/hydolase [Burkholderia lata]|uniref:C45 family autoproteolytic acyltransferase/hydolase n=1 Tax=Burkholderia lata (strain ATCC 17760 / DSM 23089 / LMG 22485 / NCIMB 9086 / R18194 / 383) TaxID=482957 RepID=UPI0014540271|nr:C45 family peptidase [Burkholderia lata]VWL87545.1 peptidase C45 [Burkholderia lata]
MKLYTFVTDTPDARERGRQIGERFAPEIRETVALYLAFFPKLGIDPQRAREIGEASLASLDAWCPDLAAEVHAIADAVDLPRWQLACLNSRTEILAIAPASTEGECSTTVYAPAGPQAPRTLQTWDWHDSLAPQGLLLQLATRHGRTVKLFSEFGMLAKLGVNSAGLGLHFNILHHASDNGSAGVPVHAIARRILEEATTVQEAIELARTARVSASTVLTVFTRHDGNPRAASIELSPSGVGVVVPRPDGWLLHTNHFLDDGLSDGECMPDSSTTQERFAHLSDVSKGMTSADVRERAAAMCGAAGDDAVVCFHPDLSMPDTERWETLLTVSIDSEACALDYVAGNPHDFARDGFLRF